MDAGFWGWYHAGRLIPDSRSCRGILPPYHHAVPCRDSLGLQTERAGPHRNVTTETASRPARWIESDLPETFQKTHRHGTRNRPLVRPDGVPALVDPPGTETGTVGVGGGLRRSWLAGPQNRPCCIAETGNNALQIHCAIDNSPRTMSAAGWLWLSSDSFQFCRSPKRNSKLIGNSRGSFPAT